MWHNSFRAGWHLLFLYIDIYAYTRGSARPSAATRVTRGEFQVEPPILRIDAPIVPTRTPGPADDCPAKEAAPVTDRGGDDSGGWRRYDLDGEFLKRKMSFRCITFDNIRPEKSNALIYMNFQAINNFIINFHTI